jgi:hypothetical protein
MRIVDPITGKSYVEKRRVPLLSRVASADSLPRRIGAKACGQSGSLGVCGTQVQHGHAFASVRKVHALAWASESMAPGVLLELARG